jgi:hypothetical protein
VYTSEAGTILRWFTGAYLERSSGHVLWSLLSIFGWLSRSRIRWLLFWAIRFLCFFANSCMTFVTYGMWRSLCKVWLDMYQGAFAIFLKVLDWNVWSIFVLEGVWKIYELFPSWMEWGRVLWNCSLKWVYYNSHSDKCVRGIGRMITGRGKPKWSKRNVPHAPDWTRALILRKPAADRLSYFPANTLPKRSLRMCIVSGMAAVLKFPACLNLNSIAVQS